MRLKSLVLKGFKSFANETVINFEEDVIGVVGPNGSGKSNIVDAIRWVLGEQKSRELRLDTMSSVIFNGSKSRKAGGLAEVTLTFENTKNLLPTEYHTVAITRRLYRTGESEYQLNGVTCRLKDITSLFLDTGIGSNSYAIIALGMVDDLLADKDNARVRMFEQAAGISKYKIRKRETLNKLKNTTADLDRVEDLLHELESQLTNLEKQAKRAKRYYEIKEDYQSMSLDLARLQIGAIKGKQQELNQKLTGEEDRYRSTETIIHGLEANLEKGKKVNLDTEKTLSQRQKDLNEWVGKLRTQENEKRLSEQRLTFVEQNRTKLEDGIQEAKNRIEQLQDSQQNLQERLSQEQQNEQEYKTKLEAAEANLRSVRESHGLLKTDLDQMVQQQQAAERDLFELDKQKAINTNRAESSKLELERHQHDLDRRQVDIEALENSLKTLEQRISAQQQGLQSLQEKETKRREKLKAKQAEHEALTRQMAKVNRDLDARRNEYKLTKSMIENLEGFPESIRFLSQHKAWDKDIPLLSDCLLVNEEYRVAIENFLDPYLNYYVVRDLGQAQQAIRLLGQSQKGKANFFLLDQFEDYEPPMVLLPDSIAAIDKVETDPPYRKLVAFLLENVLITEQEDVEQLQTGHPQVIWLSRSGRFIRRPFSVSGGSVGLFEGKKIGRKKNLEVLEKAIEKAEREANKLSSHYYNLKDEIEALRTQTEEDEIFNLQKVINQLEQEKVSLTTQLDNHDNRVRDLKAQCGQLEATIQRLEAENKDLEQQHLEKEAIVAEVKNSLADKDSSYRAIADQLSEVSNAYNQINIEFIRQQNKGLTLQNELEFQEKQLGDTTQQLQQQQHALEQSAEERIQIEDAILKLDEELKVAYAKRKEMEVQLTEAEQEYFQSRGDLNEIEDQLRQLGKQRQDTQILINGLRDKAADLKFEVNSIVQRLRIEFELDLNEVLNEDQATERSMPELEEKVERLKKRLENYGEINPMAMEAYDEMKERFDSITQQRDDILQAKNDLIQTISEIEETATAQYLYAFDQVRVHFIEVFRSLFTEDDSCDLILEDPENPLDSKIEIVAKPKGKRPQTISQLSGGEKTLTATALLFALYLLKPAPFCIFDEVDAPLDDANIYKFNRIIKKFSQDSQFIIVTHNKLTMEAVDTIYGVYAKEGVSGVTHVDFRHLDEVGAFEAINN